MHVHLAAAIIKALLAIVVILLGATANFTFQNPIASNLSGLVDPSSHFLYTLFISIDIFTIWTLLLAGIAFSCLTKVSRTTCLVVVYGVVAGVYPVDLGAGGGFLLDLFAPRSLIAARLRAFVRQCIAVEARFCIFSDCFAGIGRAPLPSKREPW